MTPSDAQKILARPGYSIAGGRTPKPSTLTLPYPPSANAYWGTRVIKKGKGFLPMVYVTTEAKLYKQTVAAALFGGELHTGPLRIRVRFFRPRKVGDLDNLLKVFLDALKGYAFIDDDQIVEIDARRFDDAANPRAELVIERAEGNAAPTAEDFFASAANS